MRRVFLVTVACCVLAGPAFAGGGVDLFASYGEVLDSENELGLGLRLSLGGENWLFDLGATGYRKVEDVRIIPENPNDDDTLKYRAVDAGLRYLFYSGHKLRPYLGAGASYASASASYVRMDGGLGLYGLAGFRFGKTPGIQLMGELIYRWAEVEARYGIDDSRNVDIGGLGFQLGASFVF